MPLKIVNCHRQLRSIKTNARFAQNYQLFFIKVRVNSIPATLKIIENQHRFRSNISVIITPVNNFIIIKISTDTNSIFQDSRCKATELITLSKFNNGRNRQQLSTSIDYSKISLVQNKTKNYIPSHVRHYKNMEQTWVTKSIRLKKQLVQQNL